jgi:hypothetical protein
LINAHLALKGAKDDARRVPGGLPPANALKKRSENFTSFSIVALCRPGGHGGAAAPVPIPNTAVKRPSAYGTSS